MEAKVSTPHLLVTAQVGHFVCKQLKSILVLLKCVGILALAKLVIALVLEHLRRAEAPIELLPRLPVPHALHRPLGARVELSLGGHIPVRRVRRSRSER